MQSWQLLIIFHMSLSMFFSPWSSVFGPSFLQIVIISQINLASELDAKTDFPIELDLV